MTRACIRVTSLLATAMLAQTAIAQPARDTLFLDDLQRAAERTDKRASQLSLLSDQSAKRIASIESERRPSLNATGVAQYLSDVPGLGAAFPGGGMPSPAKDQYDMYLAVRQPLVDPSRHARVAVEQAQVAETAARVRTSLWQQRAQVNDAFFGVVLRDAQRLSLDASIADLTARRASTAQRVDAGTALPSEVLLLDAELARRTQSRNELLAERDAARDVLSQLVGQRIPPEAVLVARNVDAIALPALAANDSANSTARARPEYAQFDRARDLLSARQSATSSQDLPRVSLFGRTGYGRPGLNALGRNFDTYASAGVQVDWTLWNWGRTKREVEVQQLQAQIVSSDEAAFTASLRRAATAEAGRITALEQSLALDDSIIVLRERVLRETRLRHDEGDLTSADYVARQTELLSAQLDRDTRRVRLNEARVRYLNTLGREVRP